MMIEWESIYKMCALFLRFTVTIVTKGAVLTVVWRGVVQGDTCSFKGGGKRLGMCGCGEVGSAVGDVDVKMSIGDIDVKKSIGDIGVNKSVQQLEM